MSKENCKCDFTIQKLYKLLEEKEAENSKLREELKREMLDGVEWAGKAGKFAHDADRLRQQLKTAVDALEDFKENGCRHDTIPTIGGRISRPDDVDGWYKYIKSMDDYVREKSDEILSTLNGTKEEEHG